MLCLGAKRRLKREGLLSLHPCPFPEKGVLSIPLFTVGYSETGEVNASTRSIVPGVQRAECFQVRKNSLQR